MGLRWDRRLRRRVDEACSYCDFGQAWYHDSRNCDGILDCPNAMDERCYGADGWICSDFATWIYSDWLCDGEQDCPDGSDEGSLCFPVSGCPGRTEFTTPSTATGSLDCTSYPDEDPAVCDLVSLDAPPAPQTGDPSLCDALAYRTCDRVDDCSSVVGYAADEVGCGTNVCGDGSRYPDAVACDGFSDCPSGSDEAPAQR
ncbi:MAG: hypothetical protein H6737_24155 [Alphaproteobacteria bacterium]|nr:hypothetical protein [Alphaproteobacteria bacterium]